MHNFLEQNNLSTFIETGCSKHLPKTGDSEYGIVNNNAIKSNKRL